MQSSLESDLAGLLSDLLAGQNELLAILSRKREMLVAVNTEAMPSVAVEEQRLLGTLQDCLRRREQLLARAGTEGLPSTSIQALTESLPPAQRAPLARQITAAGSRARLLQHQSLIHWVIVQRTLIHLSQLLEIIATGGRPQPTYGEVGSRCAGGALVDQEV